ncbi:MAG: hypothetical protein HUJ54_03520, partial [Erysipelotrichaceae bacterium]|nr:hypothetical protein [Erysipelotrichaceae bacterium]
MKRRYSCRLWRMLLAASLAVSTASSVLYVRAQDNPQEQHTEQPDTKSSEEGTVQPKEPAADQTPQAEQPVNPESEKNDPAPDAAQEESKEPASRQTEQPKEDSKTEPAQDQKSPAADQEQPKIPDAELQPEAASAESLNIAYTVPAPVDGMSAADFAAQTASNPAGMALGVQFADSLFIGTSETYVKGQTNWGIIYGYSETMPDSISINGQSVPVFESGDEMSVLYLFGSDSFATWDADDQILLVFCYVFELPEGAVDVSVQMPELYKGMTSEELAGKIVTEPKDLVLTEAVFMSAAGDDQGTYNPDSDGFIYLTYDCPGMPASVTLNGSPVKIETNIYALEMGILGDEPLAVYFMGTMMIIIPTLGSAETQPFSLATPAFTNGMGVDEAALKTVVSPAESVLEGCEFLDQDQNSTDSYSEGKTHWIQYTYTVLTRPSSVTVNGKELPMIKNMEDFLKYYTGDTSYGLYFAGQLQLMVRIGEEPVESVDVAVTAGQPDDGMNIGSFTDTVKISPDQQKYEYGSFISADGEYTDTYTAGKTDWALLAWTLTGTPGSVSLNGSKLEIVDYNDESAIEEALKKEQSFALTSGNVVFVFDYCPSEHVHVPEVIKGTDPTCTKHGLTAGEKCAACGVILKAQEEIPASGHSETVLKGKEATCTESGLTEGIECSVCHEILKAQEE